MLNALNQGGFSISFRGRYAHNVAIDEAHEMAINKDCKEAITKPSGDYIKCVATFLPVSSKSLKNLDAKFFPWSSMSRHRWHTNCDMCYTWCNKTGYKHPSTNKQTCLRKPQFQPSTIIHIFSRKRVSRDVAEDLLTFCSIGQKEFERFVEYNILQAPGVQVPKCRKRLCTFSECKPVAKRVSDVEKERKIQIECWKKRVVFACKTGKSI